MSYTPLTSEQLHRFDRQIALPQIDLVGQEKLQAAHVVIIGLGGLGCAAAQSLVGLGIGELTLVDKDEIEASNLPRQLLYTSEDIGKQKVVAAKHALSRLSPKAQINMEISHFSADLLAKLNTENTLVLDCTDNTETRIEIDKACRDLKLTCVSGAAIRFEGAVFVSDAKAEGPSYQDLSQVWPSPDESCVERGIFGPVVSIIGQYQALIAAQIILNIYELPVGTLLFFDGLRHSWQPLTVPNHAIA